MNNRKRKKSEKNASTSNANVHKKKTSAAASSTSYHKTKKQKTLMKNGLQCASCGMNCVRKELDAKQFCLLCAKMHGEGQYCPCCGKVWHYANCGPMIQCDTCEMWVHDTCDTTAAEILKNEAEALKEGGYSTFYTGKWHLGGKPFSPDKQGFDEYYDPHQDPSKGSPGRGKTTGRKHATTDLTLKTKEFIHRNRDRPFFACLSYYDIHTPIIAERKYEAHYKRKAAMLGPSPVSYTHLRAHET